jgi:hypothetical protein
MCSSRNTVKGQLIGTLIFIRPKKMLQLDRGWLKKVLTTKSAITISKIFRFFLSIVLKIKFKNNVCFNLTTDTSKYHLDISPLSNKFFTGFLLSLLSKKSKPNFFPEFFSRDLEKFEF